MKNFNFPLLNNSIAYLCGLCLLTGLASSAMATSIKDVSKYPMGDRSIKSVRATDQRIAPVGKVCLEGEECIHEVSDQAKVETNIHADAAPKAPRDGQQVVQSACFGCHGTGAAGAPIIGKPIWKELSAAKGVDGLLKSAISGKGAMPPKGMCMDCSDDEIKAAIEYMIAQ